jgi:D-glutamate cyclase
MVMSRYASGAERGPAGDVGPEDMAWQVADRIDRLLTVDLPQRARIDIIYPHFRTHYGAPLSLLAAQRLQATVRPGDLVLIATGWLNRPYISRSVAESDGPTGAAALARAVQIGLGAVPVLLVEDELVPAMRSVMHAIGLKCLELDEAHASGDPDVLLHGAAVLGHPTDQAAAHSLADRVLNDYPVGAFVAIEKGGVNANGRVHMSQGRECTATVAPTRELIVGCRDRGLATVGIGDGGNEVGMGNAGGSLRAVLPYGEDCGCGCGGGVVPAIETDVVFPVTVSNWGGYGISAALAVLLDRPDVLHDERAERRMLQACSQWGLIDGVTGFTEPTSDGLDEEIHLAVVTLLRTLVGDGVNVTAWPATGSDLP